VTHPSFLDRLARGPILCDGAMGTQLYARGAAFESCFEALNLARPELVSDIHRAYLAAGAEIIETNTFGANRYKLAEHNLADQVVEINSAGVRLARQAVESAGRTAFVAASVGPLGVRLAPTGPLDAKEAFDAFHEQMTALCEAGADVLILETFGDLIEIQTAIRAARSLCDLPIIAQMTFTVDGRTPLGHAPDVVARALAELGVTVIGANCSVGPSRILPVIEAMRAALESPDLTGLQNLSGLKPYLSAQPNAGWPESASGRIMYPATPEYLGDYARRFVMAGATIVGGCCGTTPDHIRAMRLTLNALMLAPGGARPPRISVVAPRPPDEKPLAPEPPTELAHRLETGQFVVSIEMSPPNGFDVGGVLSNALMLKQEGADVVNIADSPRARMRMSPWAVAHLVQTEVGIESVLHFPTRGRNLLRIQGDLLAAHALHVRNLFVVMGDPPSIGDYPEATDNYDVVPSGLVKLIKHNFNRGLDGAGASIGRPCSFTVGAALDLGTQDVAREIKTLRKKVEAGADFALTQPVFDPAIAREFLMRYTELYGPLKLPVLVGILPLASSRHAEFLHNEVPGITLTDAVRDRMRLAGVQGRREGIQIAQEILMQVKEFAAGVYLMPAFGRFDTAAEVFSIVR
jgi:methionine synthase I (cobalamin-dependent)/5,10-methylenetetrahydrofolate reductase